ncbi:transcription termination/antitermination NusG family protein, partial [Hoylesella saccharolytica]|uniref:transcription termination/antitermination NusG family protein n=1 Tax=Hoylesella saccharolytica TaxID=633701 RepID=UPI0028F02041
MHSIPKKGNESNELLDTDELSSPQQLTEDGKPWYAVRLFSLRLNEAMAYFTSAGLTCFVPMEWSGKQTDDNDGKPIFKPVVFNLVFVKKNKEECELRRIFANARFKMSVIRKDKVAGTYYEIPSKQMLDFMLMCSPEIEMR